MARELTYKERYNLLSDYTHTVEVYSDIQELLDSPEVKEFEEKYADDAELVYWMREAKQKKIEFLKNMSLKCN